MRGVVLAEGWPWFSGVWEAEERQSPNHSGLLHDCSGISSLS